MQAAFNYERAPEGETEFDFTGQDYRRAYARCELCGHWFSENSMDMSGLYNGTYMSNTYGENMRKAFDRILSLPRETSDNAGRAACLLEFTRRHFASGKSPRLLDVGTGLGVFPARMKEAGWHCTVIDPDERAALHVRQVIEIDAISGDFMTLDLTSLGTFDVVSFNKVLEHIEDPVAMLGRAGALLESNGFVYVEVPDGEAAATEGSGREEFFIEHHHVFSPASVALLAGRAGFSLLRLERLREPSTKFTLRAFMVVAKSSRS